jgi:hypothetical protein
MTNKVRFSIANHAAWAPGMTTEEAWSVWAQSPTPFVSGAEPAVAAMPSMLRRRAGFLGKMALEVAYQCMDGRDNIPTVFCSRHGEVARAVDLLSAMASGEPVSPAGFGLAVHNASAGLFSIARKDKANHIALAAGSSSVEHAVIEACGLLADGEPMVMLVNYDNVLPEVFRQFQDVEEQAYAWAWMLVPASEDAISLEWQATASESEAGTDLPGGLQVLRFHLGKEERLDRVTHGRCWSWTRHV